MTVKLIITTIGAAALVAPALAAPQQQTKAPVVVTARALTLDHWSTRMTNALRHDLRYPDQQANVVPHQGVVNVHFRCSDSGKPTAIALAHSSGHADLDRAALRAVKGIRTMHPLPAGISHGQNFRAVLLFAKDQPSYDRQMASIRKNIAWENAQAMRRGEAVAMTIGAASAS